MEEIVDKETFIRLVTERVMDQLADDRPVFQKNPKPDEASPHKPAAGGGGQR